MPRITTEQAPSAKPISVSLDVTTDWQTLIEVPDYDVPVVGFGSSRRIAPGVSEISSPLLVTNYDWENPQTVKLDVRIVRGTRLLASGQSDADFSTFAGGFGYVTGDTITMQNGATITVDQADSITGAVINFTVATVGERVQAVPEPIEQDIPASSATTGGIGFQLVVEEINLSTTDQHFYIMRGYPVGVYDLWRFPLSGSFLLTGDKLQIRTELNSKLQVTISFTEGQAEEDDIPGA